MTERRTAGVLKKNRRLVTDPSTGSNRQFTYYGQPDHCAICDIDFDDVPAEKSGEWTFHWNGSGAVLIAETCSDAHAMEFDVYHGADVAAEWAETVEIKQGRQKAVRKAGQRE